VIVNNRMYSKQLNTIQLIGQLLKDPDRKSIIRMTAELLYVWAVFKTLPQHYFSRFLFKRNRTNIMDYYPSKVLYKIKPYFNEKDVRVILENKLFFDFFFNSLNISLPKIWMYNHRTIFVVGKSVHQVNTSSQFRLLLKDIFARNANCDSLFIKRTYGTYGGSKIFKLFISELESDLERINDLFEEAIKSGFLFQETIKQHPELNRLNSSCVNTVRFDTFIDSEGKVDIISAYLRTSFTNHYVDNISSGGCGITVDLSNGKLDAFGYLSLKDGGIQVPVEHPITHILFKDFSIPFFEEAKKLVLQAATCIPNLRLIGWDVAIAETGPVLIEGNSDYDVAGTDLMVRGVRSNPIFRKVLKEINYL